MNMKAAEIIIVISAALFCVNVCYFYFSIYFHMFSLCSTSGLGASSLSILIPLLAMIASFSNSIVLL